MSLINDIFSLRPGHSGSFTKVSLINDSFPTVWRVGSFTKLSLIDQWQFSSCGFMAICLMDIVIDRTVNDNVHKLSWAKLSLTSINDKKNCHWVHLIYPWKNSKSQSNIMSMCIVHQWPERGSRNCCFGMNFSLL